MISDRGGISRTVGSRHFIRYKYHHSVLPPCEGIPLSTASGRVWLPACISSLPTRAIKALSPTIYITRLSPKSPARSRETSAPSLVMTTILKKRCSPLQKTSAEAHDKHLSYPENFFGYFKICFKLSVTL